MSFFVNPLNSRFDKWLGGHNDCNKAGVSVYNGINSQRLRNTTVSDLALQRAASDPDREIILLEYERPITNAAIVLEAQQLAAGTGNDNDI